MSKPASNKSRAAGARLAQRIQDEQGYVICCNIGASKRPGEIVYDVHAGDDYVPGPVVILGETSREEWLAQFAKYAPAGRAPAEHCDGMSYWRAVAE